LQHRQGTVAACLCLTEPSVRQGHYRPGSAGSAHSAQYSACAACPCTLHVVAYLCLLFNFPLVRGTPCADCSTAAGSGPHPRVGEDWPQDRPDVAAQRERVHDKVLRARAQLHEAAEALRARTPPALCARALHGLPYLCLITSMPHCDNTAQAHGSYIHSRAWVLERAAHAREARLLHHAPTNRN